MWSIFKGFVLGASVGLFCLYGMGRITEVYRQDIAKQIEARASLYVQCVQTILKIQEECNGQGK